MQELPKSPWASGSVGVGTGLKQRPRGGSRISSGFCSCWTFLGITIVTNYLKFNVTITRSYTETFTPKFNLKNGRHRLNMHTTEWPYLQLTLIRGNETYLH